MIRVKFCLQELWELSINWDAELSSNLKENFMQWCLELKDLSNCQNKILRISRKYFLNDITMNTENMQLFIFFDASLKGYGAVAYARCPETCTTSFLFI